MLVKPVLPLLEYVAFYDYIKTELCVNKDKPKLACNGKCYLMRQLSKASDTEKEKKHFSTETSIVFFQQIEEDFGIETFAYTLKSKINSEYIYAYSYFEKDSVFRPPIV
ncbi:hypothetical protein [Mesonia aestuariivivens]|uniref:Uncharacterized protein n=1 Tax=Mesonia aestuariivivens TaxID=2796128 RepID=A0ABS6W152_9FLAO|nr:hypothetical protein [Mesonia aestuariivivens]MBW2960883.1 hypothetical protein [Mesonia aestuariivivens]